MSWFRVCRGQFCGSVFTIWTWEFDHFCFMYLLLFIPNHNPTLLYGSNRVVSGECGTTPSESNLNPPLSQATSTAHPPLTKVSYREILLTLKTNKTKQKNDLKKFTADEMFRSVTGKPPHPEKNNQKKSQEENCHWNTEELPRDQYRQTASKFSPTACTHICYIFSQHQWCQVCD